MSEENEIVNYDFFDETEENNFYSFSPNIEDLSTTSNNVVEEDFYDFVEEENIDYDDLFSDIDFSDFSGKFRGNLKRTLSKSKSIPLKSRKRKKALKKPPGKIKNIGVKSKATITTNPGFKGIKEKVLVPDDRKVIIEGVNKFMLDNSKAATDFKSIGYHKGQKLHELVFTFNNNTPNEFIIDLFDPSFPLNYLHSTSNNINDKVKVAGGSTSYTDVLFNLLANPARLFTAKFTLAGINKLQQINQPLIIANKNIAGVEQVTPFQMQLNVDIDQNQNDMIYFDLQQTLNRPFIPDGMDTITYKVLPQMTVTFGFFYSQVSLKKFFYKSAHTSKGLL